LIIRQITFFEKNDYEILIPKLGPNIEPLHGLYSRSLLRTAETLLNERNNSSMRDLISAARTGYFSLEESEQNKRAFTNLNSPEDIMLLGEAPLQE
jgi:molybdopterin-guanine dinucleotide biosynthesis protein A